MTGEKGVLFTATFVTRFEEVEKQINKPMCLEDMMIAQLQGMKEMRLQVEQNSAGLNEVKNAFKLFFKRGTFKCTYDI